MWVAVFIRNTSQFINLMMRYDKNQSSNRNNNDIIKPILYVSGIRLLILVYSPTNLGTLPLRILIKINILMKRKLPTVISDLFSRLSVKLVAFLDLKRKVRRSYIMAV